jgi:hypothetical protein
MMDKALVTTIEFPEGKNDYVWCLIKTDDNITFETWIGIGCDIDFANESLSKELRTFDNKVYFYAEDLDEFYRLVQDGYTDFSILDYDKE